MKEVKEVASEPATPEPPAVEEGIEKAEKTEGERKGPDKDRGERVGPDIRAVRALEDRSIRELLEGLGNDGAFRVRISRTEPKEFRELSTGKLVKTEGFLKSYEQVISEEDIQRAHGGGIYQLKVTRRDQKGSYVYFTQRLVTIAGDPNLDDPCLNRLVAASSPTHAPVAAQAGESPTLAAKAMDVLSGQVTALREANKHDDISPTMAFILEQMKEQSREAREANARLQAELRAVTERQAIKPPEDSFKEKMITGLMGEETARISALRAQFDSELRMLKEHHTAEIRRLEDRNDRYTVDARQSHEREIANLRQSHEVTLTAARASFEMQAKLLDMDNRRLQDQVSELRKEVVVLRERVDKNKSVVEQMKEINALKEALGIDDDAGSEGTIEKIVAAVTNPAALEALKGIMARPAAPAAAAQVAQAQAQVAAQVQAAPSLVQGPDGKTYMKRGGTLVPVRVKKKVIQATTTNPDGTPGPVLELPAVAPEVIASVVGFLERAFSGNQDPVVVAQSYRNMVPEDIMTVIREHGVDVFLSKVAKLPSTSSLANQAGRNWVRKVGEALVE